MGLRDYLFGSRINKREEEFFRLVSGLERDQIAYNADEIPEPMVSCISAIQNSILQRGFIFLNKEGKIIDEREELKKKDQKVYDFFYTRVDGKVFKDKLSSLIYDLLYEGNSFFMFSNNPILAQVNDPSVLSMTKLLRCRRELNDKETRVDYYQWDAYRIPADEVIDFTYMLRDDPFYGCGGKLCLKQVIELYNLVLAFERNSLRNQGIKPHLLIDAVANEDTRTKKLRDLEKRIREIKTGNVHLLALDQRSNIQTVIQPLACDIGELSIPEWLELLRDMIYENFAYYNADKSNYSVTERKARFLEFAVNPLISALNDQINNHIMKSVELSTDLIFQITPYPTSNIDFTVQLVSAGVITPNEARESVGYERSEDPKADELKTNPHESDDAYENITKVNPKNPNKNPKKKAV